MIILSTKNLKNVNSVAKNWTRKFVLLMLTIRALDKTVQQSAPTNMGSNSDSGSSLIINNRTRGLFVYDNKCTYINSNFRKYLSPITN